MKETTSSYEGFRQKKDFPAESIELNSPYIHSVWKGVAPQHGIHTSMADGNLDFLITKNARDIRILLSGPNSKAEFISYSKGDENIGIRLRPGVHLVHLPPRSILDKNSVLPSAGRRAFWLAGQQFTFPDFDNLDTFIHNLAKRGILRRDVVVENVLTGRLQKADNERMIQRHFVSATGLPPNYIFQIRRAERALELLRRGESLARTAEEAGYSHQSHMTNSLKYLLGHTPGQLSKIVRDQR